MRILLCTAAILVCFTRAGASGPAESDSTRAGTTITIITDVDGARVYIDTIPCGLTPLSLHTVNAGVHRLKLVHPDSANWLTTNIEDSLEVIPDIPQVFRFRFERRYALTSIPTGAGVFIGDSLLGTTPLIFAPAQLPPAWSILVREIGCEPAYATDADFRRGIFVIPLRANGSPLREDTLAGPGVRSTPSNLRLIISGGITILAGIAAAYFKTQADERNDHYAATSDPWAMAERHRLDILAGISLAVTQINLGIFTYLLISE